MVIEMLLNNDIPKNICSNDFKLPITINHTYWPNPNLDFFSTQ
jgi:hypothetical protein